MDYIYPRPLTKGDTIGLITPSSPLMEGRLEAGVQYFEKQGFKVKIGRHNTKCERFLAVQVTGAPLAQATRYNLQKLRYAICVLFLDLNWRKKAAASMSGAEVVNNVIKTEMLSQLYYRQSAENEATANNRLNSKLAM